MTLNSPSILQPAPPECKDCKCVQPCLVYVALDYQTQDFVYARQTDHPLSDILSLQHGGSRGAQQWELLIPKDHPVFPAGTYVLSYSDSNSKLFFLLYLFACSSEDGD